MMDGITDDVVVKAAEIVLGRWYFAGNPPPPPRVTLDQVNRIVRAALDMVYGDERKMVEWIDLGGEA